MRGQIRGYGVLGVLCPLFGGKPVDIPAVEEEGIDGAVDAAVHVIHDTEEEWDNTATDCIASVSVMHITQHQRRVAQESRLRGSIMGEEYVAAQTDGGGPFGHHALFGIPDDSDKLHKLHARQAAYSLLPETWEAVCAYCTGTLEVYAASVENQFWA